MEDCSTRLNMGGPGFTQGLCDTMVSSTDAKDTVRARHGPARAILLPPVGVPNNTLSLHFK